MPSHQHLSSCLIKSLGAIAWPSSFWKLYITEDKNILNRFSFNFLLVTILEIRKSRIKKEMWFTQDRQGNEQFGQASLVQTLDRSVHPSSTTPSPLRIGRRCENRALFSLLPVFLTRWTSPTLFLYHSFLTLEPYPSWMRDPCWWQTRRQGATGSGRDWEEFWSLTPETQISVWPCTTRASLGKKHILSKVKKAQGEVPGTGAETAWVWSPTLPLTSWAPAGICFSLYASVFTSIQYYTIVSPHLNETSPVKPWELSLAHS